MRIVPVHGGSTTTLGFVPALVALWAANWFAAQMGATGFLGMGFQGHGNRVLANFEANTWLLGIAALAYTNWIFGVARGSITAATGGGFVIAGYALILRIVVEVPATWAQVPLKGQVPQEPYATVLPLGRTLGFVGFVTGLGFVLAAVISERRLRRVAPDWALTE